LSNFLLPLYAYKQDISATLIFKSLHLRFYWGIHCWPWPARKKGETEAKSAGEKLAKNAKNKEGIAVKKLQQKESG